MPNGYTRLRTSNSSTTRTRAARGRRLPGCPPWRSVPLCTCGPRPARGRYVISAFSGSGAAASPSICSMNEAVIAFAFLGVGPNANT